jgi:hypothetical protein
MDVSAIVAEIQANIFQIGLIGAAVLIVTFAGKFWHWMRKGT